MRGGAARACPGGGRQRGWRGEPSPLSLSSPPPHSCSEPPPLVSSVPLSEPLSPAPVQGAAPERPRRLDAGPVAAGSVLSGGGWEHAERRRWLEVDKV